MEDRQTLPLRYGKGIVQVEFPSDSLLGTYKLESPGREIDAGTILRQALAHPIASPRLSELAHPRQKVVILCSDITRPCPTSSMLPYILQELSVVGIPDEDIRIVIALGTHRAMSDTEILTTFGEEISRRFHIMNHDPKDVLSFGVTTRGTPVEFFRPVVEADLRIGLGNVEFHYFAGFSGGAKAIMPGCASIQTVAHNHAMIVQTEASTGRLEGNPLRQDIEEAAGLLPIDFLFNVVVDSDHRVIQAAAGDMLAAHRSLCHELAQRSYVSLPRKADIVLASAGGFPKDINLYQAHKSLEIATGFVRENGIIILVAACQEGFGHPTFEAWFRDAKSGAAIIQRLQQEFVLGGHKAAAIASILASTQVFLVSELPEQVVRTTGMIPFASCHGALERAIVEMGSDPKLIFLPSASTILPKRENDHLD